MEGQEMRLSMEQMRKQRYVEPRTTGTAETQEGDEESGMDDLRLESQREDDGWSRSDYETSSIDGAVQENDLPRSSQEIKTRMHVINGEFIKKAKIQNKRMRDLAMKRAEFDESKIHTGELRAKNEEISLLIDAADKEETVFHENLRKETANMNFFKCQVFSTKEQVVKLKREANKTKIKHVQTLKLRNVEGLEELKKSETYWNVQLDTKKQEYLVKQEQETTLGNQDINAKLFGTREQLTSIKRDIMNCGGKREVQLEKLRQEQLRRDEMKAKHDEVAEEQRTLTILHEEKMKLYMVQLESQRVALENAQRQREHTQRMVQMERNQLDQMKKNWNSHETELGSIQSTAVVTTERYNQLKTEVAKLIEQKTLLNANSISKETELNEIGDRLTKEKALQKAKQEEKENLCTRIETFKMSLDEKSAKKEALERTIEEKEKEDERNLQTETDEAKRQFDNEIKTLDEKMKLAKLDKTNQIKDIKEKIVKIEEYLENLNLSHSNVMYKLSEQQAAISEQLSTAEKQLITLREKEAELEVDQNEIKQKDEAELKVMTALVAAHKEEVEREKKLIADEIADMQEKKATQEQKKTDANHRLNTVTKDKDVLETSLKELRERVEELRLRDINQKEQVEKAKEDIQARKQQKQENLDEMCKIRTEMAKTQAEYKATSDNIANVQSTNEKILQNLANLNKAKTHLDEEKRGIEKNKEELKLKLEKMKTEHVERFEDTTETLKTQLMAAEDEKAEVYDNHQRHYEQLVVQQMNAKKALDEAKDELKALQADKIKEVSIVQNLLNEKAKIERKYKQVQEMMNKMQIGLNTLRNIK